MALRYIDTGFYKSPFVRSLKGPMKSLYNFIITDCSGAGIWVKDLEIASMFIGFQISDEDFNIFIDKKKGFDLGNGKYFFPDFIEHQYPNGLSDKNPAQKNFISELRKYNLLSLDNQDKLKINKGALEGLCTPFRGVAEATMVMETVKVMEKEMVEVKSENPEILKVEIPQQTTSEILDHGDPVKFSSKPKTEYYDCTFLNLQKQNIKITVEEFEKLCTDFTQPIAEQAIKFFSDYKIEKVPKTKSDYLTIRRWVIDAVIEKNKKQKSQNGSTKIESRANDTTGGIPNAPLAEFLGISPDELFRVTSNGG